MKDQKKKNFFKIVLGGAGAAVMIVFFIASIFVLAADNLQKENTRASGQLSETDNVLRVYEVDGKIIDIQDKTIFLETPVFDFANKRWDKDKKELRKLTVGDKTEFFKIDYVWQEGRKKFEPGSVSIKFEDFKIGDFVGANYSEDLTGIKDFPPKTIIILANYKVID